MAIREIPEKEDTDSPRDKEQKTDHLAEESVPVTRGNLSPLMNEVLDEIELAELQNST